MNINPLFSSVKLNEEGLTKVAIIRQTFTMALADLEYALPGNSREISIIKTKLEEASFYAVKAVRNYIGNIAFVDEAEELFPDHTIEEERKPCSSSDLL